MAQDELKIANSNISMDNHHKRLIKLSLYNH